MAVQHIAEPPTIQKMIDQNFLLWGFRPISESKSLPIWGWFGIS